MLRHAYESTTLSRRYQDRPFFSMNVAKLNQIAAVEVQAPAKNYLPGLDAILIACVEESCLKRLPLPPRVRSFRRPFSER